MKKTNAAINAAIAVLFVGVLIYLGFYMFRSFNDAYVTAQAVYIDLEETGQAKGIIVRDETVLFSSKPYVDIVAQDGKNIAVGETVANAMDSETSMNNTARMHELEMQISRAEAAADNSLTTDSDAAIQAAIFELSAAVARGEVARVYDPEVIITSQLFRSSDQELTDDELTAMKAELEHLQAQTASAATAIPSPVAGIFTTAVDGYEHLTLEDLEELTPASFQDLTAYQDDHTGYLGKVVVGAQWHFAALVSEADANRLTEGGTATLELGKYASGTVEAVVTHISHPQNGQCAVVFKCRTAMNETLALRELTADIVYEQISGLRVPAKAVHVEEDGSTYVYVISALQVEKKNVDIIYNDGEYYVVAIGPDADALRAGNEIVVSGRNIEEGEILA